MSGIQKDFCDYILTKKRITLFIVRAIVFFWGFEISRDHHNHFTLNILIIRIIIFINKGSVRKK